MNLYDFHNREERAICAHLFRLLHEDADNPQSNPLGQFLKHLFNQNISFTNGQKEWADLKFKNIGIYTEVAIIRDAYFNAKPNINEFMDKLVTVVMQQEGITKCRLYSELEAPLNDPKRTHPKQIRQKATTLAMDLSSDELIVYGAVQGMFNAKPDLVITIDDLLLVCEAKFTQKFDVSQIKRTENIAAVWAKLLYKDFGFSSPPKYTVFKLGAALTSPDINWQQIATIATQTYPENDRTRICLEAGVGLLKRNKLTVENKQAVYS